MNGKTHFAPAERSPVETVMNQFRLISSSPFVSGLLRTVCGLLAILNDKRQIVALNDTFMEMLGIEDPSEALGLRPGEALRCIHIDDGPSGCGTTRFCSTCGAALSIVAALGREQPTERLCALSHLVDGIQVETVFLVAARPVELDDSVFVLIFLQDATESQRRAALERTFFHDVSNLLSMLLQAGELLEMEHPSQLVSAVNKTVVRLTKEVEIQKLFTGSEKTSYSLAEEEIGMKGLMEELKLFFRNHPSSAGRKLVFRQPAAPVAVKTDRSILSRVLENMIINALEATRPGRAVLVEVQPTPGGCLFKVHNEAFIPASVKRRIFQRNFSTKDGPGRGYGTYAMKLLGEDILGGSVSFTSSRDEGTVFSFHFPVSSI